MQKIISLFKRECEETRLVYDSVVPDAEWVIDGEGTATRKWDGTSCLVRDGSLYKRYTLRQGKTASKGYESATDMDARGKQEGWVPVDIDNPNDQYHVEAFDWVMGALDNGTYELVGAEVQGGIEGFSRHVLLRHGLDLVDDAPRTFDALRDFLDSGGIEGIVWHHLDGRMVKIKAKDFGVSR